MKITFKGLAITKEEAIYRESKKEELLLRLQKLLRKTRNQVIELFRYYNNKKK